MNFEYRPLHAEDTEQAVQVEALAFYNQPEAENVERYRRYLRPDWTVGAFLDGRLVADVRTIPMARRINGGSLPFGCVGPVACLAAYRRQGHVGRLLRIALERMREQGVPLSGLHTPHDLLYAKYGWERAEGKKQLRVPPKDVALRLRGRPGSLDAVAGDDWQRLDAIYRRYAEPRNGPLERSEPWWRQSVLLDWRAKRDRDAFVWRDGEGSDQGYVVYTARDVPTQSLFPERELLVREFVALTGDAYLGIWEHLLTHDLASRVIVSAPLDDPFPNLTADPWKIEVRREEGAMIRIVDVERALALRPYCGEGAAALTMRIHDQAAPWNDGTWRLEAHEGRMQAERADAAADVELSAGTLAPIFTGFLRPDVAAAAGLLEVHRPQALSEMARAFAVTHPPYCKDWY